MNTREITTESIATSLQNNDPVVLSPIITQQQMGEHELGVTDMVVRLSNEHQQNINRLTRLCLQNFVAGEDTLAHRKFGMPTLLARVDCTITDDGIKLFECEERPAGIGITDIVTRTVNQQGIAGRIFKHYESTVGAVPVVLRHDQAAPNDDHLLFDVQTLHKQSQLNEPLIVRGEPGPLSQDRQLADLTEQSVSTIVTEGDKSYLLQAEEFGVRLASEGSLPEPGSSFVLKPAQGSKARGVAVYLSPEDRLRHGKKGTITHSRAQRVVAEAAFGDVLLEDFKPPIPVTVGERGQANMILRVFALVNPGFDCQTIGGTFVMRPELIVHGASNAICGPVLL